MSVIFTGTTTQWIDLLVMNIETKCVNPENLFLFATESYRSLGHARGCDCFRVYSKQCESKYQILLYQPN